MSPYVLGRTGVSSDKCPVEQMSLNPDEILHLRLLLGMKVIWSLAPNMPAFSVPVAAVCLMSEGKERSLPTINKQC
jgi:hypothetical protein